MKRALTTGMLLFVLANVLAFFAPTIDLFIAVRALQAAGAGAATVVGAALTSQVLQ